MLKIDEYPERPPKTRADTHTHDKDPYGVTPWLFMLPPKPAPEGDNLPKDYQRIVDDAKRLKFQEELKSLSATEEEQIEELKVRLHQAISELSPKFATGLIDIFGRQGPARVRELLSSRGKLAEEIAEGLFFCFPSRFLCYF